MVAAVVIFLRSPLRTWLRFIDAISFPPLVAAAIAAGVYLADLVLPWSRSLLASQQFNVAAQVGTIGHETLTILSTILVAAVGPGMLLWWWRRKLYGREDNIHNRRAERASMALERRSA